MTTETLSPQAESIDQRIELDAQLANFLQDLQEFRVPTLTDFRMQQHIVEGLTPVTPEQPGESIEYYQDELGRLVRADVRDAAADAVDPQAWVNFDETLKHIITVANPSELNDAAKMEWEVYKTSKLKNKERPKFHAFQKFAQNGHELVNELTQTDTEINSAQIDQSTGVADTSTTEESVNTEATPEASDKAQASTLILGRFVSAIEVQYKPTAKQKVGAKHLYGIDENGKKHAIKIDTLLESYDHEGDRLDKKSKKKISEPKIPMISADSLENDAPIDSGRTDKPETVVSVVVEDNENTATTSASDYETAAERTQVLVPIVPSVLPYAPLAPSPFDQNNTQQLPVTPIVHAQPIVPRSEEANVKPGLLHRMHVRARAMLIGVNDRFNRRVENIDGRKATGIAAAIGAVALAIPTYFYIKGLIAEAPKLIGGSATRVTGEALPGTLSSDGNTITSPKGTLPSGTEAGAHPGNAPKGTIPTPVETATGSKQLSFVEGDSFWKNSTHELKVGHHLTGNEIVDAKRIDAVTDWYLKDNHMTEAQAENIQPGYRYRQIPTAVLEEILKKYKP